MNSIFLRSTFILFSFAFAASLQAAPPQISYVSGAGPHPTGTTSVTIEISTDILSNCRLNEVDDGNPSQWTTLLTTSNNLNHTSQVSLSNDADTARYIYCRNVSSSEVSSSYTFNITFSSSNIPRDKNGGINSRKWEKRVSQGWETTIAKHHGEMYRKNYGGRGAGRSQKAYARQVKCVTCLN